MDFNCVVSLIVVLLISETSSQNPTWKSPSSISVATSSVWSSKPSRKSVQSWNTDPGAADDVAADDRLARWNPVTPSPRVNHDMAYSRNRIYQFANSLQRNVNNNKWTRRAPVGQIVPQKPSYHDVRFSNSLKGNVNYKNPWSSFNSGLQNTPRRNTKVKVHNLWKDQTDPTPHASHWSKYDENENSLSQTDNNQAKSSTFVDQNFDKRINNWQKSVNTQISSPIGINSGSMSSRDSFNSIHGHVKESPWAKRAERRFHESIQSNNMQIPNSNMGFVTNHKHGKETPRMSSAANVWKSNFNAPQEKSVNNQNTMFQQNRDLNKQNNRGSSWQKNPQNPNSQKLIVKKYLVPRHSENIKKPMWNKPGVISSKKGQNQNLRQPDLKHHQQNQTRYSVVQSTTTAQTNKDKQQKIPVKFIKVDEYLQEPIVWKDNNILYVLYNVHNNTAQIPNQNDVTTTTSSPHIISNIVEKSRFIDSKKSERFSRLMSKHFTKENVPSFRAKPKANKFDRFTISSKARNTGINTFPTPQNIQKEKTLFNANRSHQINVAKENPQEASIQVVNKSQNPPQPKMQRAVNFQNVLSDTTPQWAQNNQRTLIKKTERNTFIDSRQAVPHSGVKEIQTASMTSDLNKKVNNKKNNLPHASVSIKYDRNKPILPKFNQLFKPNFRLVPKYFDKQQQNHQLYPKFANTPSSNKQPNFNNFLKPKTNVRVAQSDIRNIQNVNRRPLLSGSNPHSDLSHMVMRVGHMNSQVKQPTVPVSHKETTHNLKRPVERVSSQTHAQNVGPTLFNQKQTSMDNEQQTKPRIQAEQEQVRIQNTVLITKVSDLKSAQSIDNRFHQKQNIPAFQSKLNKQFQQGQVIRESPVVQPTSGSNFVPNMDNLPQQTHNSPTTILNGMENQLHKDKSLHIENSFKHRDVVDTNIQPKLNNAPDIPVRNGVFTKEQKINRGYTDFQTQFVGTRKHRLNDNNKSNHTAVNMLPNVSRDQRIFESQSKNGLQFNDVGTREHRLNDNNKSNQTAGNMLPNVSRDQIIFKSQSKNGLQFNDQRKRQSEGNQLPSSIIADANQGRHTIETVLGKYERTHPYDNNSNIPTVDRRLKPFPELQKRSLDPIDFQNRPVSMEISKPVSQKEIVQMSLNPGSSVQKEQIPAMNIIHNDRNVYLTNIFKSAKDQFQNNHKININQEHKAPPTVDEQNNILYDQRHNFSSNAGLINNKNIFLNNEIQTAHETHPKQDVASVIGNTAPLQEWQRATQSSPSDVIPNTKQSVHDTQNVGVQTGNKVNYYGTFESSPADVKSMTLQDIPIHDIPSEALSSILDSLGNGKTLSNIETLHMSPTSTINGNVHRSEQLKQNFNFHDPNINAPQTNIAVKNALGSFQSQTTGWQPNVLLQESTSTGIQRSRTSAIPGTLDSQHLNIVPVVHNGLSPREATHVGGFNQKQHHTPAVQETLSVKYDVRHPDGQSTRETFDVLAPNVQRIVKFKYNDKTKSHGIGNYIVIDRKANMFGFRSGKDTCFVGTTQPGVLESFENILYKARESHTKSSTIKGNPRLFFYVQKTPISYNELNRTAGTYIAGSCGTAQIFRIKPLDKKPIKTSNGDVIPGEACHFGKPLRNPSSWHVVPCPHGKCPSVGHTCNTQYSICCPDMTQSTECTSLSIGQFCVQRTDKQTTI